MACYFFWEANMRPLSNFVVFVLFGRIFRSAEPNFEKRASIWPPTWNLWFPPLRLNENQSVISLFFRKDLGNGAKHFYFPFIFFGEMPLSLSSWQDIEKRKEKRKSLNPPPKKKEPSFAQVTDFLNRFPTNLPTHKKKRKRIRIKEIKSIRRIFPRKEISLSPTHFSTGIFVWESKVCVNIFAIKNLPLSLKVSKGRLARRIEGKRRIVLREIGRRSKKCEIVFGKGRRWKIGKNFLAPFPFSSSSLSCCKYYIGWAGLFQQRMRPTVLNEFETALILRETLQISLFIKRIPSAIPSSSFVSLLGPSPDPFLFSPLLSASNMSNCPSLLLLLLLRRRPISLLFSHIFGTFLSPPSFFVCEIFLSVPRSKREKYFAKLSPSPLSLERK